MSPNSSGSAEGVLVLMSTYNGSQFLAEQLESIIGQSHREWTLLVRDDGSSDSTVAMLETYSKQDDRIHIVRDHAGNVGAWRSFGLLLKAATAAKGRYFFFSDQDDVWFPDKISTQLKMLRKLEKELGESIPILVHSDLEVVDASLDPINPSFRDFQRTSYDHADPLGTLLIHNAVVGCSACFNRAALTFAVPLPAQSPHDWWLALAAASLGKIGDTPRPTVRYRQHGRNAIGAQSRHAFVPAFLRHPRQFVERSMTEFAVGVDQAAHLYRRLLERGHANSAAAQRVKGYVFAFRGSSGFRKRYAELRASGARPRRRLSRLAMLGLLAAFPRFRRNDRAS